MDLAFAHRSFQEYFTARFIDSSPAQHKSQLISRFSAHAGSDAVFHLLFELDPYSVEEHYLLPALQRLREQIGVKRKVGITHYVKFIRLTYNAFRLVGAAHQGLSAEIARIEIWNACKFAQTRYLKRFAGDPAHNKAMYDAFQQEFEGESSVHVSKLKPGGVFIRALAASKSAWGISFLSDLLRVEAEIRRRHSQTKSSLDAILG